MAETIKIGGELESTATGNVVAAASAIKDKVKNMYQSEINAETDTHLTALDTKTDNTNNTIGAIDNRLSTVEELAEISVGGGDIGIATAADFESDNPSDLAKVPTVGAMLGGANDGVYDISARHNGTKYADLAEALGTNGANVPLGVRRGGMSVKFVQSSDNKYVQYRLMNDAWSITKSDWQGVIDEPVSESDDLVKSKGIFEAIKKSERGFIVDYNHLWNWVGFDSAKNRYMFHASWDCIWVVLPKNAYKVNIEGVVIQGLWYFSSLDDISNNTEVYFRSYTEERVTRTLISSGGDLIPYFNGEDNPVLLLIDIRKADQTEGFTFDDVHIWFDYVENTVNCESSLNNKKISILGDSISSFATYTYWMNDNTKVFANRYPARNTYAINNVNSIHQMWWKRLFDKCGAVLEVGSCIGSSGISDNRMFSYPSYLDRYADLGNPDVILIEGFHNEPSTAACTFDPLIPIGELDTLDVGQAYDKLIRLLKITYQSARIIDIVVVPEEKWVRASREIDDYYNIEHIECLRSDIDYTTITTDAIHPDSDGMERIADYVIERLANNATHVATVEFVEANMANTLEEKEISYSEEDVAGYITDKKGAIIGKLMKNGAVEWTVKNSREIFVDGKISDIEESIQGISGNLSTQTERIDELDENAIREVTIEDVEENAVSYITDRKGVILAKILKSGAIERTAKNQNDIVLETLVSNIGKLSVDTLQESIIEIEDDFVAGYITDKNKVILAKINKDGSIDRLVENEKDKHTIHFEDVDIEGIVNLLTDKNNNVIASINNKAEIDFYGGGGFAGEKIVEAKTGEYVRLIISKNNLVIGGIKPDGTVKIFKAEIANIADTQATKTLLNSLPLIATGIDNIEVSRSKKMQKLLTSVNSSSPIEIDGVNIELHPCLSIIDDDTSDDYIPSSQGRETVKDNPVGGFFSLLLPLLLSLGDKYGKKFVAGLACEGHRVGLTTFHNDSDTYSQLNTNGQLIKQLVEHEGWDVLNHSMAASIPTTGRTYGVESINSEVANTILANGTYVGYRSFQNTMVLELSTGKWYQVNSTCTAWEEVNGQKYGQMYYQDYTTGEWFVNRNFDWEYNWGEWFKRAKELGLPFIKQIVHNGNTCTPASILQSRRYAYCSYDIWGNYNVPPTCAAIKRRSGVEDNTSTNVQSSGWKARFLAYVDSCIADNGWMPLMVHFSEERFYNGYRSGLTYENKDVEYEPGGSKYEWIHPLTENELLSMDANNYWTNPPARLNISSWAEWIPASGTQLRVLYDVLDYAISNGVEIVSPSAGWDEFGNIIQLGVDRNGQTFIKDADLKNQYSDAEKSYLTIGADKCIRYFSK